MSDHHDVGDGHAGHDDGLTDDEGEDQDGVEVERERTMVGQRRIWGGRDGCDLSVTRRGSN